MPQIIPVKLDQVERIEEYALVVAPVANAIDIRESVLTAGNGFPSIMQEWERSFASASTMRGKRYVRSLPARLLSLTRLPILRAMTRKPSHLISGTNI